MKWAGHVARMEERRGAYRALVGKSERKNPLGKTSIGWKDNIKMNLEVLQGFKDWIDLAQIR